MSILRDALSILARWFGLRPGPDVDKLPEPIERVWKPTCMVCGADVEDRGSMHTRYRCDECIAADRKIGWPKQEKKS